MLALPFCLHFCVPKTRVGYRVHTTANQTPVPASGDTCHQTRLRLVDKNYQTAAAHNDMLPSGNSLSRHLGTSYTVYSGAKSMTGVHSQIHAQVSSNTLCHW